MQFETFVGTSHDDALGFKIRLDASLLPKKESKMYLVEIFGYKLFVVSMSPSACKVAVWDHLFHKDAEITDISQFRIANEGRQITLKEYVEEKRDTLKEKMIEYLKANPELAKQLLKEKANA